MDRAEIIEELPLTSLAWDLAALRAVEDNPHRKILRKVLETMRGSRSNEQNVA